MKFRGAIGFLVMVAALVGCASRPATPEERAQHLLQQAEASMQSGDWLSIYAFITSAIDVPGQTAQVNEFFGSNPSRRQILPAAIQAHIDHGIYSPKAVSDALRQINRLDALGYLDTAETIVLTDKLAERARQRNRNDTLAFMLDDDMSGLGLKPSREDMDLVLSRTLDYASRDRNSLGTKTAAIMSYAASPQTPHEHKSLIESRLDEIPISKVQMETLVRPIFPKYANERLASMTMKAFLDYSGADRLAYDDLLTEMKRRIRGVEWQPEAGKSVVAIKVDRIRYDESSEAPRTETIRYSQGQVNVMAAVLFMPQNATYAYNYTTNSLSIEYGFEVSVIENGKTVHTEVVRGRDHTTNSNCSGATIQNVFGGIQPAGFVANDDMAARCRNTETLTMDDLRKRVDRKVVDAVMKAPNVKRIHGLNS